MKQLVAYKTFIIAVTLILLSPVLTMADPPGPGGSDPFPAPVNANIAIVVIVAFLYGVYRIYKMNRNTSDSEIDR